MEIEDCPELRELILKPLKKRTIREGLHQSDIATCLRKPFFAPMSPEFSDPTALLFIAGRGHHTLLEEAYLEEAVGVNERSIEVDGILVTPDVVMGPNKFIGAKGGEPIEIKSTRKSSKTDLTEQVEWINQMKAECKVTNSQTAFLVLLWLMGDFAPPTEPDLWCKRIIFTQEEIDEWWQELLVRKAKYERCLAEGKPVPIIEALKYPWECKWCDLQEYCIQHEVKENGVVPELSL